MRRRFTGTTARALVAALAIAGTILVGAISPATAAPFSVSVDAPSSEPTDSATPAPEPTDTATPTPAPEPTDTASPEPTETASPESTDDETDAPELDARDFSINAVETRTVTGTVYKDSIPTRFGAGDVAIQLRASTSPYAVVASTSTDPSGNFTLTDVTPGVYQAYFQYNGGAGYYSQWGGTNYVYGSDPWGPNAVNLTNSNQTLDQPLQRANSLTGTVKLGVALAGANLVAVTVRSLVAVNTWSSWSAPVYTNASGQYTFPSLAPGEYQLNFSYVGSDHAYQTDWAWPSGFNLYTAFAVDRRLSSSAIVKDATIAAAGTISGNVYLGATSHPAGAGEVTVTVERYTGPSTPYAAVPEVSVTTDAAGHFSFPSNAGTYRLTYTYNGTGDFKRVSVGGSVGINPSSGAGSASIDYTIEGAYSLAGKVMLADAFTGTRAAGAGEVEVSLVPAVYGAPVPAPVLTDASGNYQFTGVAPVSYYVKYHYTVADSSTLYRDWGYPTGSAQTLVAVSGNRTGLNVTMGDSLVTFTGTARDSSGVPVAGVDVYLTMYSSSTGEFIQDFTTTTSALGRYEFYGMPNSFIWDIDFESPDYALTRWPGYSYYYYGGFLQPAMNYPITGLDVVMLKTGTISGTVSWSGRPVSDGPSSSAVEVVILDHSTNQWVETGDYYPVASDGSYLITDVYPDHYKLLLLYSGSAGTGSFLSPMFAVAENQVKTYSHAIPVASLPFAKGTLVKSTSASTIYLWTGEVLVPISTFESVADLGLSTAYTTVSPQALAGLTVADNPLRNVIRCDSSTYLAASGRLWLTDGIALGSLPYTPLPSDVCAALPKTVPAHPELVFLKSPSSPTVYLLSAGLKRAILNGAGLLAVASGRSYTILTANAAFVASIPTGADVVEPGTLIRSATAPTIYMADGAGGRIPIASFEAVSDLGLSTASSVVSDSTISGMTLASSPLRNLVSCGGETWIATGGRLVRIPSAAIGSLPVSVLPTTLCAVIPKASGSGLASPVFVKSNAADTVFQLVGGQKRPISSLAALVSLAAGAPIVINMVGTLYMGTIPSAPEVLPAGVLVRSASAPTIYLVDGAGGRIPIASFDAVSDLGLSTASSVVSDVTVASLTPAASSLLNLVSCAGETWLATGGRLIKVPSAAVGTLPVSVLPSALCAVIPKASGVGLASPVFVKSSAADTVFQLIGGVKKSVSSPAALVALAAGAPIVINTIGSLYLSTIPSAPEVLPAGVLVRSASAPTIYLVDGAGARIPIASFDTVSDLGLSTASSVVSDVTIASLTLASSSLRNLVSCGGETWLATGGRLIRLPSSAVGGLPTSVLSSALCAVIPKASGQGLSAPVLVKSASADTVYQLVGGQKKPIGSLAALVALVAGAPIVINSIGVLYLSSVPTGSTIN